MSADAPVTVTIHRRVKAGREHHFKEALREFIPQALRFPGHLGVQVLHPQPGASPEWVVVIKFQSRPHYEAFRCSPEYTAWCEQLQELLESQPVYREQSGLESWFALPGATTAPLLPRWKMALVTWVGVNIAVLGLAILVGNSMEELDWALQILLKNALVVVLLTWAIMPVLTQVCRPLLFHSPSQPAASTEENGP